MVGSDYHYCFRHKVGKYHAVFTTIVLCAKYHWHHSSWIPSHLVYLSWPYLLQGLVYLTLKLFKFSCAKWSQIFTKKIPAVGSPVLSLPKSGKYWNRTIQRKNRNKLIWKYITPLWVLQNLNSCLQLHIFLVVVLHFQISDIGMEKSYKLSMQS